MQIYTSSWFTKLPPEIMRIGISRGVPRGIPTGFRRLKELEPGGWFNSVSPDKYHELYMAGLAKLNAKQILGKIELLANGRQTVALLCFEPPGDPKAWCHRGQVSAWFFDELGLQIPEFGLLPAYGWDHPKLFQGARNPKDRSP